MGSIISAGTSIIAGNKAAKTQRNAAASERELAQNIFDTQQENQAPFLDAGRKAQAALNFELGLGERPVSRDLQIDEITTQTPGVAAAPQPSFVHTGRGEGRFVGAGAAQAPAPPTTATAFNVDGNNFDTREAAQAFVDKEGGFDYRGFQATPGYEFNRAEGIRALERSAAAVGATQGGAFAKGLERFGQGLANQEYNTFLNRLGSQSGAGQVATQNINAAGSAFGQQAGATIQRAGDARASSFANIGNAISSNIRQEEQNSFQAAGIGASFFGGAMGGF